VNKAYPATIASCSALADHQETERKSIFSLIISALHDSRSLEAQRIFQRYAHLNAEKSSPSDEGGR
jgi:hypothetical protein